MTTEPKFIKIGTPDNMDVLINVATISAVRNKGDKNNPYINQIILTEKDELGNNIIIETSVFLANLFKLIDANATHL
jgi:hypothetical protein